MVSVEDLEWTPDGSRFSLRDLVFIAIQIEQPDAHFRPGENCFGFHKVKRLVDEYLYYLRAKGASLPRERVVELGLFDGGSIPFWFEVLEPLKHVGIDIQNKTNPSVLEAYIHDRRLEGRIETHWRTNQSDRARLREICATAFEGHPIDLVIDDASHFYEETLASFETLFPLLRPGGHYIIEDWAWFHWRGIEREWRSKIPLTHLIQDLVAALGTGGGGLVASIEMKSGFAAIERGPVRIDPPEAFRLSNHIHRHPR